MDRMTLQAPGMTKVRERYATRKQRRNIPSNIINNLLSYMMIMSRTRSDMSDAARIIRDLHSPYWSERQSAVRRIAEIRRPEVLRGLLQGLRDEKWYIREAASAGIRALDCPDLVPDLVGCLGNGDEILRNAAALALGNICLPETASALERVLTDPDCRVRKSARVSLERIRSALSRHPAMTP